MTIIFPQPTRGDRLLAILGKKRAIRIPDLYRTFGAYAYGRAIREPFLQALFRPKNQPLPPEWFYLDDIAPQPETMA